MIWSIHNKILKIKKQNLKYYTLSKIHFKLEIEKFKHSFKPKQVF